MNMDPRRVTAHRGIDSRKPVLFTASMISWGITVLWAFPKPTVLVIVEMMPCTISNIPVISSIPYMTNPLAIMNRRNSLKACSGLLTYYQLVQVLISPQRKNSTNRERPIAWRAPWIFTMIFQISPPLKVLGDWVNNIHISASFSFQVFKELVRLSMIPSMKPLPSCICLFDQINYKTEGIFRIIKPDELLWLAIMINHLVFLSQHRWENHKDRKNVGFLKACSNTWLC